MLGGFFAYKYFTLLSVKYGGNDVLLSLPQTREHVHERSPANITDFFFLMCFKYV